MRWLDWLIVVSYLAFIVWDGLRRTKSSDKVEGYFLGNRSLPWWAVGLSVMATQLSAITLVGTTGQGYRDGLRFVQFYFGLPIAMLILSVTAVPFFYRAGVYTAYEYLERRFDAKTRTLTSALFLLSRVMQCGVIISAPSVILSVLLGWNLPLTVLAFGAADRALHDDGRRAGGDMDRREADVRRRVGGPGGGGHADLQPAIERVGRRCAAHRGRHRPDDGDRFQVRPVQHVHLLVGDDRRVVPDAVVLRLRSEPGAAVPDGEVGGGGALVAVHQRLREDPPAGADPAGRRAGVHALPVREAADALQPRPRDEGARRRRCGPVCSARSRLRCCVHRAP